MKQRQASEEVETPRRFHPSAEWILAFQNQFNDTLLSLAVEYANELDAGIGSDPSRNKRYSRALVLRALADTQLGILHWDHTTPLKPHIEQAIRNRSQIEWKRARRRPEHRYRHLRIDDTSATSRSRVLDELDRQAFNHLTDHEKAYEGLAELRARAANDPQLQAYIDARCRNSSRAEILREMGLSPEQYRQVARRLRQLIQRLSIEAHCRWDGEEGREEGKT
jgi:hypothetical protein